LSEGDGQRLYILDASGVPLGYVFMGGNVLYSMDGKRVTDISEDITIKELKRILLRRKTWYVA